MGYPPFYDEEISRVIAKIIDHENSLVIPEDANVSQEAKDLIFSLITKADARLSKFVFFRTTPQVFMVSFF